MGLLLRPFRLFSLLLLAGLVFGAWWVWKSAHAANAASVTSATADVAAAGSGLLAQKRRPASGVYRYRANGEERVGIGPFGISRSIPDHVLLVVKPLARGIQQQELRLSDDHVVTVRTLGSAKGPLVLWRSESIGVLGMKRSFGGEVDRAAWRPRQPKLGQTTSTVYRTEDGIVISRESRVASRADVKIGSSTVQAWVLEIQDTFSGPVRGVQTEKVWWLPELGLDARRDAHGELSGAGEERYTWSIALEDLDPIPAAG